MAPAARRLRHQDYTVAWVCALPLEMAVAEAMLDEKHPSLPTSKRDDNTYILGKICAHNVVIACLQSGVYGTTSAAALTMQLKATFESIRFGLMVGIGGGVPSAQNDIRLGDIVVSKPTRDFGGVVQFDYGKATSGGQFERTGVLNKPPSVLLTAISRIQAAHISRPSKIPALLSEAADRKPLMKEKFTYCGENHDQLFEFDYEHKDSESTCDKCDQDKLVTRPARLKHDPVIHYGLIASGNKVMKHGRTRDKLARELGILCFEMEAAGLMDNFPCLVIRGICDYSDSHKNKQWQPYAAAVAAAYAKELLSAIHASRVEETPVTISSTTVSVYRGKSQLQRRPSSNWISHRSIKYDKAFFERISAYDHEKVHQRLSHKRLTDTTQWFLHHSEFTAWFEGKFPCLWCSGKIGSGKTIIATAVVEAAKYRSPSLQAPTIFFYCENEQSTVLQGSYILSSFIKQLCTFLSQTSKPFPEVIKAGIKKFFGHERIRPDFEDLEDIFARLFHYVPDAIYIVDGLDNLDREHGIQLLKVFRALFCDSTSSQGSRILLLSREQIPGYIDITAVMPGIHQISTSHNVLDDIEAYIEASIADKSMERKLTDDPVLLEEMKQVLLSESSGMFLWVYLQLEIIWETCVTDAEIRSSLSQLPKGLEQTYRRCVERINFRDSRALKVLKWVSFATNPLHIDVLREAVAFDIGDRWWDAAKIPRADFVIGCCANLVIVDPTDNCVRFAHSSVRQYLKKDRESCIPGYPLSAAEGELECGEFCIAYLSFSNFGLQLENPANQTVNIAVPVQNPVNLAGESLRGPFGRFFSRMLENQRPPTSLQFRKIRTAPTPNWTQYRFLDYATANWALQTKLINKDSPMWHKFNQLALCFNESWNFHPWVPGGRSSRSHLHGLFGWAVKEQHIPLLTLALSLRQDLKEICNIPLIDEGLPALHVAAKFGYNDVIRILVGICEVNSLGGVGYTPLHHAAIKGHFETVRLLSSVPGVKIDALSTKSQYTPLWFAANNGHTDIVAFLITKKADVNIPDKARNSTPLSCAVINGHSAAAELLIENGSDLDTLDAFGRTPLSWAAEKQHENIMKLLLEKGADPAHTDRGPLLLWAARNGYGGIVNRLLVNIDSDKLNFQDEDGLTPLSWAVLNRHELVARVLFNNMPDTQICDYSGRSPLLMAVENEDVAIVRLLLERNPNPEMEDDQGRSPLSCAIEKGQTEIMKLLSTSVKDDWTPLIWAAARGKEATVSSLIKQGVDLDCLDTNEQTPLSWAAKEGHESVVKLLLDSGAHVNSQDKTLQTPLLRAAMSGHELVMKLLLNSGADVDSKDKNGQTALSWAARNGHESVVKLLLDSGADIDSEDTNQFTALSWAIKNRHVDIVNILRETGANDPSDETILSQLRGLVQSQIDKKNSSGMTSLAIAAAKGDAARVALLLEQGAEVNTLDNQGMSPLSRAAWNGHTAVVSLLLEKNAHLESTDRILGRTPLVWAAVNGREIEVKLLLQKGANIEARDRNGMTALSWAAKNGLKTIAMILLDSGADLETEDDDGQTPLTWAREKRHEAMIQLLWERGRGKT